MPIFDEIRDAVANENFKVGASWPAQRLQHSSIDFDRMRTQMGDNSVERQNEQNRSFHLMNGRLMKGIVEEDISNAVAIKEIGTGVSPTSQGYHWANANSQENASLSTSIHQLESTMSSLQALMYQMASMMRSGGANSGIQTSSTTNTNGQF